MKRFAKAFVALLCVTQLTACGAKSIMGDRGWEFRIGISPVSAIDNRQQFKANEPAPTKERY